MSQNKIKEQEDNRIYASYEETKKILGFDDFRMTELLKIFNITSKVQYSIKQLEGFIDYLKKVNQDSTIDKKILEGKKKLSDFIKANNVNKTKGLNPIEDKQKLEDLMKQRKEMKRTSIAC